MSSDIKVGDKVVRKPEHRNNYWMFSDMVKTVTKITPSGCIMLDGDRSAQLAWDPSYFDRYSGSTLYDNTTLQEQVVAAKYLVGKKVYYYDSQGGYFSFVVTSWVAVSKETITLRTNYSQLVHRTLETNDVVIVINGGAGLNIPITIVVKVEEVPKAVKVKINSTYDAEVFKDKIVVGCTTVSQTVFEEIMATYNRLNS
jgi:hypothetical protein